MDFSKISTGDLRALKEGRFGDVSTEGLQEYKNQRASTAPAAAQQPPSNHPRIGDSLASSMPSSLKQLIGGAAALHQGMAKGASFGNLPDLPGDKETAVQNPALSKAGQFIGNGVAGSAIGAGAGTMLPTAAGILPSMARVGGNAIAGGIQGALQKPEEGQTRLGNAGMGVAAGGLFSGLAEGAGGLWGGAKRMWQTAKLAHDPAAAQDMAINAISDATGKLKSSEAENLARNLQGKTTRIDTTRIRGIHPEIDDILAQHSSKLSPYGNIPSELEVPTADANKIRQLIDGEMTYKKLGPYAQNAETATRDAQLKSLADQLRGQVHSASPEVSNTLDQWSDNLNAARNLGKRAETAPITVLTSPSVDRRALLQKVDTEAGTKLQDLGNLLNGAKNLSNSVHHLQPLKAALALGSAGLQGAKNGGAAMDNPVLVQALTRGLFTQKE